MDHQRGTLRREYPKVYRNNVGTNQLYKTQHMNQTDSTLDKTKEQEMKGTGTAQYDMHISLKNHK